MPKVKPTRGLPGAGQVAPSGDGRAEFFQRMRIPMVSGTGKAPGSKKGEG